MRIAPAPLKKLVATIFQAAGCQEPEAERISHYLVEANLVGNSWNGGPFGCGMCGGCCGSCGGRWGFGYTAGFRYMNIFDRFIYSSSPTFVYSDPAAANYLVATTNNLFGFQLGGGISYCVTNRFTAYAIGKVPCIWNFSVTMTFKLLVCSCVSVSR